MFQVLDYLLNRSTTEELEVIQKAIQKRLGDLRKGIAGVNIHTEVKKISESIQHQFIDYGELNEMIQKFIRDIVRQRQPEISEEQLSLLLEKIIPSANSKVGEGKNSSLSGSLPPTENLPQELIDSMVVQFIDYSLGRMSADEKKDLAPDWTRRYWNSFPTEIRQLLSDLIRLKMTEREFWKKYKKISGEGT